MLIAHITDLHVQSTPRLQDMTGKRIIGTANLYLLGRRSKFSIDAQRAAISAVVERQPDAVMFTGDLTAQSLDAEFSAGRELMDPILSRFPTVMIPGNHDTYVREKTPGDRMREMFGQWMGEATPHLHRIGDVAFLTLETCRCHPLSSGYTPEEQLDVARELLDQNDAAYTFLCIHYPLVGRRGEAYGPATRALSNAETVREWVASTPGINAIVHGHEHHGFHVQIDGPTHTIDVLDPGASGYAHLPEQDRTAHVCFYRIEKGQLVSIERMRFDGTDFKPEPGGPFSTGR